MFAPERKGPMRLAAWRYRGSSAGSSPAGRRLTVFSIGVAFLSIASFVGAPAPRRASPTSGTSPAGPTPASRARQTLLLPAGSA
jgi:hypothetical protein